MSTIEQATINTKLKCEESYDGKHTLKTEKESITGYICRSCEKPILQLCQVCSVPRLECENWNDYYGACEGCLK